MSGRAAHLQQTIRQGEELVANNHFGADKIKERIEDIQVHSACRDSAHLYNSMFLLHMIILDERVELW